MSTPSRSEIAEQLAKKLGLSNIIEHGQFLYSEPKLWDALIEAEVRNEELTGKKRAASAMGKSRSDVKVAASRENGKLGGRPKTKK